MLEKVKKRIKNLVVRIFRIIATWEQLDRYLVFRNMYNVDSSFGFNGESILFYGDGEIECRENSYIGSYSTIQAYKGCHVIIGKNCSISHNVRMYTQSNVSDQDFSMTLLLEKKGDIIIGDYVWIGANVFIGPGVHIGANCIIGANSVVVKDVETFSVVGGVPARLIRYKTRRSV